MAFGGVGLGAIGRRWLGAVGTKIISIYSNGGVQTPGQVGAPGPGPASHRQHQNIKLAGE